VNYKTHRCKSMCALVPVPIDLDCARTCLSAKCRDEIYGKLSFVCRFLVAIGLS
jgi:hypothetical protein